MSPLSKLFMFYSFNNVIIGNTIVWKACEKELPNIMDNELTTRQRECVKCVFFDGLSQKETAEKLGIAQPTVCRHVSFGAEILLNRLSYVMKVAKAVADHYESEERKWLKN